MNSEMIEIDQNYFLNQAENIFISAVKLGFLTWESMGICSLLQPASSGHERNCSFSHFSIGITGRPQGLPLGLHTVLAVIDMNGV